MKDMIVEAVARRIGTAVVLALLLGVTAGYLAGLFL